MSATTTKTASADMHEHGHHDSHNHGSLKSYLTGFALSVVLTAIPFWLVMGSVLGSNVATALTILGLGAIQMVVHMVYFLHMDVKSENGWSFMALMFTLILVVITLVGSVWVMYHLNSNMMAANSTLPLAPGAAAVGSTLAEPAPPSPQNIQLP